MRAAFTALGVLALAACSLLHPLDGYVEGGDEADAGPATQPIPDGGAPPDADTDASPRAHHLYVIGGSLAEDLFQNDVYYATIEADGAVGPFVGTTPLPYGLRNHVAVVRGDAIYVIGGELTNAVPSPAAFVASFHEDGTIGAWKTLPDALDEGRRDHAGAVWDDQLYLTGGASGATGASVASVTQAALGPGTIGPFRTAGQLEAAPRIHAAVTHAATLYSIGGSVGSGAYAADVSAFSIGRAGELSPVTGASRLPVGLGYHRAVASDRALYVVGGVSNDGRLITFTSDVYLAPFDAAVAGGIGAWRQVASFDRPRWRHAAAIEGADLYVVGGREGQMGPFLSDVQVGRIGANGDLTWRTLPETLPRRVASHALVIH